MEAIFWMIEFHEVIKNDDQFDLIKKIQQTTQEKLGQMKNTNKHSRLVNRWRYQ